MFKFNFDIDGEKGDEKDNDTGSLHADDTMWYDSKEVVAAQETLELLEMFRLNATEVQIGNIMLKYMIPKFVLEAKVHENFNIKTAEENHTDLIPGFYEGGAKLWECTFDLIDYLNEHPQNLAGKRVLDLGCGCGLLGIFALKHGSIVHFQDYNEDVLQNITIPNVMLNMNENLESLQEKSKFYSGDWSKYVELTSKNERFDLILSSETIYNPQNQKKLLETFAEKLNDGGKVYVAAKTYYFGVGGSLRQFEELIKVDNRFSFKTVWTSKDGVKREILELTHTKRT